MKHNELSLLLKLSNAERNRLWYKNHRQKKKAYAKEYRLQHPYKDQQEYRQLRNEVIGHYSNNAFRCVLCGSFRNLDLHHIHGDGSQHRKTLSPCKKAGANQMYLWAKRNNFPPIFEVLCRRCNKERSFHAEM